METREILDGEYLDLLLRSEANEDLMTSGEQSKNAYMYTLAPAYTRDEAFPGQQPINLTEKSASQDKQKSAKGNIKCDICLKEFKHASSLKTHRLTHTGDHPYPCPQCGRRFTQASSLKTHQALHSDVCKYRCETCKQGFKQLASYRQHLLKHGKDMQLECEICHKKLSNHLKLKSHMRHHRYGKKQSNCEICGLTFAQTYMRKHMEKHSDEVLPCQFCNKTFYDRGKFEKHKTTHDPNMPYNCNGCDKKFENQSDMKKCRMSHTEKKFKCTLCQDAFKSAFSLRSHMMVHSGERPFSCKECDAKFRYKGTLKRHMLDHVDPANWPYECETCHKKFKTGERLKFHSFTHTGGSAYECSICGMGYACQQRLDDHLLLHNKQEGTCKICSKHFTDKEQFVNHGTEHSPVDLNESQYKAMLLAQDQKFIPSAFFHSRGYMCHVCDFIFPSRMLLKHHLPDHLADKPFMCMICKKQLASRKTMKEHMLLHVGQRKKCTMCPRSFVTNSDLKKHIQKIHLQKSHNNRFPCNACGKNTGTKNGLATHKEKFCIYRDLKRKKPATSTNPAKRAKLRMTQVSAAESEVPTEPETPTGQDGPSAGQHKCEWCHATFGDEETLKTHTPSCSKKITVVGKQSFHCVNCNQAIRGDPSSLLVHQFFHKKAGSITCNICQGEFWPTLPSDVQQVTEGVQALGTNFVFKFLPDGTIQQHALMHNKTILGDQYILVHSEQKDGKQVSYPPTVKSAVLPLIAQNGEQIVANKETGLNTNNTGNKESGLDANNKANKEPDLDTTEEANKEQGLKTKKTANKLPNSGAEGKRVSNTDSGCELTDEQNQKVAKSGSNGKSIDQVVKNLMSKNENSANNVRKSQSNGTKQFTGSMADNVSSVRSVTAIPTERDDKSAVSVLLGLVNQSRTAMGNKSQK